MSVGWIQSLYFFRNHPTAHSTIGRSNEGLNYFLSSREKKNCNANISWHNMMMGKKQHVHTHTHTQRSKGLNVMQMLRAFYCCNLLVQNVCCNKIISKRNFNHFNREHCRRCHQRCHRIKRKHEP